MQAKINKTKNLILYTLLIMLFTQCYSSFQDDELLLPLKPYVGNELRIDGYCYNEWISIDGDKFFKGYIFYENGVMLSINSGFLSISELEESLIKNYINEKFNYKDRKYVWGKFVIENNIIKFERWYPASINWKGYIREGIILNDTTFHITKSYRSNGTNISVEDEIYHFRQFSPKPDSTNNFIK